MQGLKPRKGGKGGKHGRVQIGNGSDSDRLLLHFPMCMKYPDHENCVHEDWCEKTFTERSGSITIDTNQYTDKVSCLWQFDMPASHTIEFQFVGDFDLEYHYKCGYDRVHIFSGKYPLFLPKTFLTEQNFPKYLSCKIKVPSMAISKDKVDSVVHTVVTPSPTMVLATMFQ